MLFICLAHNFARICCFMLYLLDVRQTDESTTFKNELRNWTKQMARQALPRLHWAVKSSNLWNSSWPPNSPDLNPFDYCMRAATLEKFQELKSKLQNVTDLKWRCRLSGMICLMKQFTNLFWAFANHSWHASKLKADIQTFD